LKEEQEKKEREEKRRQWEKELQKLSEKKSPSSDDSYGSDTDSYGDDSDEGYRKKNSTTSTKVILFMRNIKIFQTRSKYSSKYEDSASLTDSDDYKKKSR